MEGPHHGRRTCASLLIAWGVSVKRPTRTPLRTQHRPRPLRRRFWNAKRQVGDLPPGGGGETRTLARLPEGGLLSVRAVACASLLPMVTARARCTPLRADSPCTQRVPGATVLHDRSSDVAERRYYLPKGCRSQLPAQTT